MSAIMNLSMKANEVFGKNDLPSYLNWPNGVVENILSNLGVDEEGVLDSYGPELHLDPEYSALARMKEYIAKNEAKWKKDYGTDDPKELAKLIYAEFAKESGIDLSASQQPGQMNDREFFDHIQKVNEELKKINPDTKGIKIYAGQIDPKIYSGPSVQSEASDKAPDFIQGVDNLMKKVNDVVGDPNAPDTPMTEAFRNANKNRNRNRNRGQGRGHHD